MEVSYTMLSSIMTCEYLYYLRYVKKIKLQETSPSVYGTAIHAAIKIGYDNNLAREDWAKAFKAEWMALTSAKTVAFIVEGEYYKKFRDGQQMLLDYYDKYVKGKPKPYDTELFFGRSKGITLGSHLLIGVIDQIDADGNVIDYKSGVKPTVAKLEMDLQFTMYSYAYRQLFGKEENGLILRHLGTMKDMPTTRTESDFTLLLGEVDKVEKKLSVKDPIYVRSLGRNCESCYYLKECLGKERKTWRSTHS